MSAAIEHAGAPRAAPAPTDSSRAGLLAALAAVERRHELAGASTAVVEAGQGPPIVLLHGPGEFAARWLRVIPDLATTHCVVAPDLPGHGDSQMFEGGFDAGRVLAWLDDLIESTCQSPPVLVGHLLGGSIAARFAVGRGDRLRHVVLVDSFGLGRFRPSPAFAFALFRFVARPTGGSYERFMNQCLHDRDGFRGQIGDRQWDLLQAYSLELARTPRVRAAMRAFMSGLGVPRIPTQDLERIDAPTALIWGRHDRAMRLRVGEAASARYGWPLHVIEGAADDPPMEQPGAFIAALRSAIGEQCPGGKGSTS